MDSEGGCWGKTTNEKVPFVFEGILASGGGPLDPWVPWEPFWGEIEKNKNKHKNMKNFNFLDLGPRICSIFHGESEFELGFD